MGFKKWLGIDAPTTPDGPRTVRELITVRWLITCAVAIVGWFVVHIVGSRMGKDMGPGLGLFVAVMALICVVAFIRGGISAATDEIGGAKQSDNPRAAATAPAGWLTDPTDSTRLRYWDGRQWTNQYAQRHKPGEDQGQSEQGDGV